MKKYLLITILCLLLTACSRIPSETPPYVTLPATALPTQAPTVQTTATVPTETTESVRYALNVYCPNENYEGFATVPTMVDQLDPNLVLEYLIQYSMLEEGILLNSFDISDGQIQLDFNKAFQDQLKSYGTSGENMMIGCVVNTYLYIYEAETVFITVNGKILESGHVIYDFPLHYVE